MILHRHLIFFLALITSYKVFAIYSPLYRPLEHERVALQSILLITISLTLIMHEAHRSIQ